MTPDELAHGLAQALDLSPSPEILQLAHRRICAWGRLAQFGPLLTLPGVVRVDVIEHGKGPPHLAPGSAHAAVWVQAGSDAEVQRLARRIHEVVEAVVWPRGVALTVAVGRARWRDRAVGWWRWRLWDR
jgi:hypothetical protein